MPKTKYCDLDGKSRKYCANSYCEWEAEKRVEVSINQYADAKRWFCVACENAYSIGVQHGSMRPKEAQ